MLAERAATWPKQWMAEGYESGLLDGQRRALSHQVTKRFGALEPRYDKLIAQASEVQLQRWLEGVLSATAVDDLFRA